jgi:hypothetical protein
MPIKPKSSADQPAEVVAEELPTMPSEKIDPEPEVLQMPVNEKEPATLPSPDPATVAFYESNAIPYCKKCGQQVCSDLSNKPFCPYEATDCPVLTE